MVRSHELWGELFLGVWVHDDDERCGAPFTRFAFAPPYA